MGTFISFLHAVVFLLGHSVVFLIHPLVLLFASPKFVYDCILSCFSFLVMLIVASSFSCLHFMLVSCNFIPFILVCCLLFHLGVFLSFLSVHGYFFVFPTLCMIVFCCSFSFGCGVFFFISLLFLLLFVLCTPSWIFVILVHLVSTCCCLLLDCSCIVFVHWYFFVFPLLCMIVFCCSCFSLWAWCFPFL